jgi:3-methyl-2-oxobutanoate hydroxymethyltransferase
MTTEPVARKRVRTRHFAQDKAEGVKIVGLTSYDMLTAKIFDAADIDFLLVGDSAANVVLGYDSTIPVSLDELIPLTRAVATSVTRALVIADMPFGSYEEGPDLALRTAMRFMKETHAHAVKLEGGVRSAPQIRRIVESGIPVMGHVGFTPQSEHGLGGHLVQGRGAQADAVLADAVAVQEAGAFAVVLELMPAELAKRITETLTIPTISVGAGPHCDGQLMVWTDFAGMSDERVPRFVKQYAQIAQTLRSAAESFRDEVRDGIYPSTEHSFSDEN